MAVQGGHPTDIKFFDTNKCMKYRLWQKYLDKESKLNDKFAEVSKHKVYYTLCNRWWANVHVKLY